MKRFSLFYLAGMFLVFGVFGISQAKEAQQTRCYNANYSPIPCKKEMGDFSCTEGICILVKNFSDNLSFESQPLVLGNRAQRPHRPLLQSPTRKGNLIPRGSEDKGTVPHSERQMSSPVTMPEPKREMPPPQPTSQQTPKPQNPPERDPEPEPTSPPAQEPSEQEEETPPSHDSTDSVRGESSRGKKTPTPKLFHSFPAIPTPVRAQGLFNNRSFPPTVRIPTPEPSDNEDESKAERSDLSMQEKAKFIEDVLRRDPTKKSEPAPFAAPISPAEDDEVEDKDEDEDELPPPPVQTELGDQDLPPPPPSFFPVDDEAVKQPVENLVPPAQTSVPPVIPAPPPPPPPLNSVPTDARANLMESIRKRGETLPKAQTQRDDEEEGTATATLTPPPAPPEPVIPQGGASTQPVGVPPPPPPPLPPEGWDKSPMTAKSNEATPGNNGGDATHTSRDAESNPSAKDETQNARSAFLNQGIQLKKKPGTGPVTTNSTTKTSYLDAEAEQRATEVQRKMNEINTAKKEKEEKVTAETDQKNAIEEAEIAKFMNLEVQQKLNTEAQELIQKAQQIPRSTQEKLKKMLAQMNKYQAKITNDATGQDLENAKKKFLQNAKILQNTMTEAKTQESKFLLDKELASRRQGIEDDTDEEDETPPVRRELSDDDDDDLYNREPAPEIQPQQKLSLEQLEEELEKLQQESSLTWKYQNKIGELRKKIDDTKKAEQSQIKKEISPQPKPNIDTEKMKEALQNQLKKMRDSNVDPEEAEEINGVADDEWNDDEVLVLNNTPPPEPEEPIDATDAANKRIDPNDVTGNEAVEQPGIVISSEKTGGLFNGSGEHQDSAKATEIVEPGQEQPITLTSPKEPEVIPLQEDNNPKKIETPLKNEQAAGEAHKATDDDNVDKLEFVVDQDETNSTTGDATNKSEAILPGNVIIGESLTGDLANGDNEKFPEPPPPLTDVQIADSSFDDSQNDPPPPPPPSDPSESFTDSSPTGGGADPTGGTVTVGAEQTAKAAESSSTNFDSGDSGASASAAASEGEVAATITEITVEPLVEVAA